MRSLHVACLPFPTPQGTQALLKMMLRALGNHGHDAHLLCYAHGCQSVQGRDDKQHEPFVVHRLWDMPRVRSERSGPSIGKVALDAQMVWAVRRAVRRLRPDVVFAHNVEAALATRTARIGRWSYYAHTSFRDELPFYANAGAAPLRALGDVLDHLAAGGSERVLAVAPALAADLSARLARTVLAPPVPWPMPAPIERSERDAARRDLGVSASERVYLYAGNLDAYQGWEAIPEALPTDAHLLVATQSDAAPVHALRRALTHVWPLAHEVDRRRAHAAADVVVVPRQAPGGLPIKLLDAMSRGVPCLVAPLATAGLAVPLANADAPAFDLGGPVRQTGAEAARRYIQSEHADVRFAAAIAALA